MAHNCKTRHPDDISSQPMSTPLPHIDDWLKPAPLRSCKLLMLWRITMTEGTAAPRQQGDVQAAIDGWYTLDRSQPQLLGSRCTECGSYYFPKTLSYCRNPQCDSSEFEEVPLSRHGKIWSYTNACYKPPEPFVADDPFEPFAIAAVELEKEQMIVMGQVVKGIDTDQLKVGQDVELVLETLHQEDGVDKVIWKWQPVNTNPAEAAS